MKRIAFIDLGSNSVRFVIYEISKTGSYRLIYQEKESVRLSENMWGTHELTKEAMERSLRALKGFVHMADAMEVDTIKAVATAAVRLAKNGDAFIKSVKERTGLDLERIAGEEEARLGFLGVINTIGLKDFIIFDLGGASTEITLVRNRHITKSVSLPIGALTLTGTYQKGDEYTPKELDKLTKVVKKTIKEHTWLRNVKLPLLGIGGTARNIAKMDQRKLSYPITKLHNYEIPYHTEIMENFDGIDLDSARRVAGNGFYYLMGDIARLHSAVISYARDFMINRGFTYCVPPFMIRSNVVTGVMSFAEMDAMMYKIEGEDLYLIGTSEHSMIGKFIDQIIPEEELPKTLTSYSPCFRKEKGAHGLEERGVYRIHQFEKQEMIVVCRPEESPMWFDKLWQNTVDLFRSLDIPVRTLECCSGDLADLKVKSLDVEAWSPRQKKYFEVGSCSNLGDAQARRLKIRVNGKDGKKYLAHTLNNTVVAPPRMLIAFLENNLNADGSVSIPKALQPYMGGMTKIEKKHA